MRKALLLILLVIILGTLGYYFLEGWPLLDGFYMTIITIFTVGFREVQTLTLRGQVFTVFIILAGVGTLLYAFTQLGDMVFGGGMSQLLWRKKMERQIRRLKDHYIICGYGRMGHTVVDRFSAEKVPYVVIEIREERAASLAQDQKVLVITGDATQEEVLVEAGVKRARALAALLPTDADNLYLTLTAKLINPAIFVLAKALEEEGEKKILQIGANRTVSPYKVGGLKIAQALLRPTLVDFMDLIIRRQEISLAIEEITVPKNAKIAGHSLADSQIRKQANVIVVAVKKPGMDINFNPSPDITIETGDTLLVLGDEASEKNFEKVFIRGS
jgi:voltage-gated potassium channel